MLFVLKLRIYTLMASAFTQDLSAFLYYVNKKVSAEKGISLEDSYVNFDCFIIFMWVIAWRIV